MLLYFINYKINKHIKEAKFFINFQLFILTSETKKIDEINH